jgi:murein DD-endopeptidase MepM/ murein hydrolase activator NlpD
MSFNTRPFIKRIKRLFHAKNVVVVSTHAVDHYALSLKSQVAIATVVLAIVGGASYSVGRYIEAKDTIQEQGRAIEQAEAQNEKINSEYALLKRDLMRMDEEGDNLSDYAQFVIDQYQQSPASTQQADASFGGDTPANNTKLFDRLHVLESELEEEKFMNEIHHLTRRKIKALEKAVEITGMKQKISALITDKTQKLARADAADDAPEGGPYVPYDDTLNDQLTEQDVLSEVTYLAHMVDSLADVPIAHPMPYGRFTSGFGRRLDPFRRALASHTGVDYAGAVGSEAKVTANGRVVYASYNGAYGRMIDIDHGNGFVTRYGHLSKILVRRGGVVKKGQVIGIQGSTGRSTGNHLHYEIRYNGVAINPIPFIKAGQYVFQTLQQEG